MFKVELSEEVLQKYIDILPISYYLGRKINIQISHGSYSYHSPFEDLIKVSLPQLSNLTYKSEPSEKDIEKGIRCMLYHEISHAILTPSVKTKINHKIFNIFEDERIETLLGSYYKDVDFKDFVKRINDYNPEVAPRNELEYFYRVVRFRDGKEDLVDRVDRIIKRARFINSSITEGLDGYSFDDYQDDIDRLYEDCKKHFLDNYEKTEEVDLSEKVVIVVPNATPKPLNIGDNTENIDDDVKKGITLDPDILEDIERVLDEILGFSKQQNTKTTSDKEKASSAFKDRIKEIISNIKGKGKKIGNTLNTYSGRLTPRLTINNDYKWFMRENMGSNRGEVPHLLLNLFIDISGSFCTNEAKMNGILEELEVLEDELKEKFSFNLITMGYDIKLIKDKKKRRISCSGGTNLKMIWKDTFDLVQDSRYRCVNIIMFDGLCYDPGNENVFSIFNRTNSTLIADISNSGAINKYCSSAKKVFLNSDCYTAKIEENIISTLVDYVR